MKKETIFILILLMAPFALLSQSLDDYLLVGAENNPEVRASFLLYHAALERIPQTSSLPDPEMAFGYFISPIETRVGPQNFRLSVSQMFPWFGSLEAKEEMSIEVAKAKYELFEQKLSDLQLAIKSDYFKLLELEEKILITEEHISLLSTMESIALSKFESGTGGMVDILRIQMNLAESANSLIKLEDMRIPFRASFNRHLNRTANEQIELVEVYPLVGINLSRQNILDSIRTSNHKLESLHHLESAGIHSQVVAQKAGDPSFGIGLSYIAVNERSDVEIASNGQDAFMPMMTMKIPINRRKYNAGISQAEIEVDVIRATKDDLLNDLFAQFEKVWAEYMDAGRRIALYETQISRAESTEQILLQSYASNGKDFEEVLRIQQLILKFKLELIMANTHALITSSQIENLY